jgi:hypothetical protein
MMILPPGSGVSGPLATAAAAGAAAPGVSLGVAFFSPPHDAVTIAARRTAGIMR